MEPRRVFGNRKLIASLTASVLLILATVAWLERSSLWASYCVHKLAAAKAAELQIWAEHIAALDIAAVPKLLDYLSRTDAAACGNTEAGLLEIVRQWEPGDPRRADLAHSLAAGFATFSVPGQQAALTIQANLLQGTAANPPGLDLLRATTRMLVEASSVSDTEVRSKALVLAAGLIGSSSGPEMLRACRKLAQTCLGDEAAANRVQAISLAARPELGMLKAIPSLLTDSVPEVRRAALLAVGTTPAVLNTDDLLAWLHDPDPGVRELCEKALLSRGLRDEHVNLGRLMTDSRPGVRLQVLDRLRRVNDLEPGIWLRRLSHDPAAAVRAATIRAAVEDAIGNLSDRLQQMAQNDPSPSVRQLAQYYLTAQQIVPAGAFGERSSRP